MRDQADVWLGFEPAELKKLARAAGLEDARVTPIPAPRVGRGPDGHIAWQILVAKNRPSSDGRGPGHVHERQSNRNEKSKGARQ
jgi:hypothetical protein